MKRFPAISGIGAKLGLSVQRLSESPDERSVAQSPEEVDPLETADQIEEEGPTGVLLHRLEQIDEAQRRVEDLVVQLMSKLDKS